MSLWIKWSASAHKDAVISSLTDTQFRAFITILEVAKEMRKDGRFRDRQHLSTVIGHRLARAVPRLILEGLLEVSGDGVVTVSGWSRWQVDATSAARAARYRAQKEPESRSRHALEKSRAEQRREEQTLTNTRPMQIGEILRGRR
jgi:hypothetical protein